MVEVEVKVVMGPLGPFVRRIEDLAGASEHPRCLEDNVLLDLMGGELTAKGAMLRVRTYGATGTLTYKEPAQGPPGYKVRTELETTLPDPGLCLRILESAGFRRIWRYVKYRAIYRIGELKVLVDETPIGGYAELEGPREAIDAFAKRIGKEPSDYIASSYRGLYEDWCRRRGVPFGDMVFAPGTSP